MFESIASFFKKLIKSETKETPSKDTAKERLHLVLMQDRANVSADFLELMKQEIIEVIKKYIEVEESAIDVRLTNEIAEDGTKGAPSLYANIPILNIKNNAKKENEENNKEEEKKEEEKKEKVEEIKEEKQEEKVEEEVKKEEQEEKIEKIKEEEQEEKQTEQKSEETKNKKTNKTKKEDNKSKTKSSNYEEDKK